jgi:hypothetical protein
MAFSGTPIHLPSLFGVTMPSHPKVMLVAQTFGETVLRVIAAWNDALGPLAKSK